MLRRRGVLLFASVLASCFFAAASDAQTPERGYKVGEAVRLECKDWQTGAWGPGPLCKETGKHMKLSYGRDSFLYCGIELAGNTSFAQLTSLVRLSTTWHCRVGDTSSGLHFVPFVLPLWGVAEGDHLHVDNHVNFALHAEDGKVVAVAAYPVRDRFQFVKDGSVLSLHGPVRWFKGGSFSPLASSPAGERASALRGGGVGGEWACSPTMAAAWSVVSTLVTTAVLSSLYFYQLKPQLVQSCLKAR